MKKNRHSTLSSALMTYFTMLLPKLKLDHFKPLHQFILRGVFLWLSILERIRCQAHLLMGQFCLKLSGLPNQAIHSKLNQYHHRCRFLSTFQHQLSQPHLPCDLPKLLYQYQALRSLPLNPSSSTPSNTCVSIERKKKWVK